MRPAPSVILFTTLSGCGFGTLALAGLGQGGVAAWGAGYALAILGLVASTFHLRHPARARFAFRQWRTSWLSREAWACLAALAVLAPVALAALSGLGAPPFLGAAGAALCLVAVFCTSMIYAQLRAVPRWHHWTTPAVFLAFALTGGALVTLPAVPASLALLALSGLLAALFRDGDRRIEASDLTLSHALGLGATTQVRSLELPRSGPSYVTRELVDASYGANTLGLRVAAVVLAGLAPAALRLVAPEAWLPLALALHLGGAIVARWLFFAEATHVAALYYGRPLGRA